MGSLVNARVESALSGVVIPRSWASMAAKNVVCGRACAQSCSFSRAHIDQGVDMAHIATSWKSRRSKTYYYADKLQAVHPGLHKFIHRFLPRFLIVLILILLRPYIGERARRVTTQTVWS